MEPSGVTWKSSVMSKGVDSCTCTGCELECELCFLVSLSPLNLPGSKSQKSQKRHAFHSTPQPSSEVRLARKLRRVINQTALPPFPPPSVPSALPPLPPSLPSFLPPPSACIYLCGHKGFSNSTCFVRVYFPNSLV